VIVSQNHTDRSRRIRVAVAGRARHMQMTCHNFKLEAVGPRASVQTTTATRAKHRPAVRQATAGGLAAQGDTPARALDGRCSLHQEPAAYAEGDEQHEGPCVGAGPSLDPLHERARRQRVEDAYHQDEDRQTEPDRFVDADLEQSTGDSGFLQDNQVEG